MLLDNLGDADRVSLRLFLDRLLRLIETVKLVTDRCRVKAAAREEVGPRANSRLRFTALIKCS